MLMFVNLSVKETFTHIKRSFMETHFMHVNNKWNFPEYSNQLLDNFH